ncbi:MAG: tetratricopeptide repeat protein [Bradymonadia bacterium]
MTWPLMTALVLMLAPNPTHESVWQKSVAMETQGDFAGALKLIEARWLAEPTLPLALRRGWLLMKLEQPAQAVRAYGDALTLAPTSEDALLGLQWAHLSQSDWSGAAQAGRQALEVAPMNAWATGRQGLALFMLGDYDEARTLYVKALAAQPDNGEFHLGMGFTLKALGEVEASATACNHARRLMPEDPRIPECLASTPEGPQVWGAASSSVLFYSGALVGEELVAYTVSAGAALSPNWLIWAGGNASTLARSEDSGGEPYNQVAPIAGIGWRDDGWRAGVSVVPYIFANEEEVEGTNVFLGHVGRAPARPGALGADLDVAWTRSPGDDVIQLDPMLHWAVTSRLTLGLGPEIQLFPEESGGVAILLSGHLDLDWRLHPQFGVGLLGYAGPRRYPVTADGLSIWTGGERFTAGVNARLSWQPLPWLEARLAIVHDTGDEQYGVDEAFSITGGTLGLSVSW